MRPVASNTVAVHIRRDEQPVPDQPVEKAIHRLADVKLQSPYERAIPKFLGDHKVRSTGDPTFDDCIFQGVLFTEFFDKVEKGEVNPGQWEEHDRPALYLLKKSVELLQPLGVKIEATCRRYDEMLLNSPPELRATLEKELKLVEGMAARFQTLESSLLGALAHPQEFRPTRDKACFLLFAHAMLSDATKEVQRWIDDLASDPPRATLTSESGRLMLSYMTKNKPRSNLFSSEPLTPADHKLYKKCLSVGWELDDMEKSVVPSFSGTSSQGVLAMLHCIFNGKSLLTAAILKPHPVHDRLLEGKDFLTLRHDCAHLEVMIKKGVFSRIAPKLLSVYQKLEDPSSNIAVQDVKRDLMVLFYMLHENTTLLAPPNPDSDTSNHEKSFLDCAREYFSRDFEVVDTIPLLNKIGFSIAPTSQQSSPEEKAACYEAVAQAVNSLWKEFRGRHGDDLAACGLFAELPRFLAD